MPRDKRRRAIGEGGLFQRADGMWIGTVDLGWVDGKRCRKTVSSRTYLAAADKLEELKRNLAEFGVAPDKSTMLEKWLTYWLENIAAPRTKPRTMQGYRTTVSQHIVPHIGNVRLDLLTAHDVRRMHTALAKAGLAGSTALKAHSILRKSLNDAMREGKAIRNVATQLDAPRKGRVAGKSLTADQAKVLLSSIPRDVYGARWAAALLLGARQGEVLGLTWDRVDLTAGTVDLAWQLQRLGFRHGCDPTCTYKRPGSCPDRVLDVPRGFEHTQLDGGLCLTKPKSRQGERLIPLPPPMLALLKVAAKEGAEGLVWHREGGRPIDPSDDNKAWHAELERAVLPSVPLHAARHTTATLLLELGVDAEVIRTILGHSSVVVSRGYMHADQTLKRAAMKKLGKRLSIAG